MYDDGPYFIYGYQYVCNALIVGEYKWYSVGRFGSGGRWFEEGYAVLCTCFLEVFHDYVLGVIPSFVEGYKVRSVFLKSAVQVHIRLNLKNWLYGPEILRLSG